MTFKVGITRDLLTAAGTPAFGDRALDILNAQPHISWEWLPDDVPEITPDIAARYRRIARQYSTCVRSQRCPLRLSREDHRPQWCRFRCRRSRRHDGQGAAS